MPESFPETDAISYGEGGSIKFTDEKKHPLTYTEGIGQRPYTRHSSHPTKEDAEKVSKALSKNFYNVTVPSKGEFVVYKDLFNTFSEGGSTKGFEYSIGGL